MKKTIAATLKEIGAISNQKERIEALQRAGSPAIRQVLKLAVDPSVVWVLPESRPPYVPSKEVIDAGPFYAEVRRLYLFIKDGHPNLKQTRREQLFVELLSNIAPDDAEFLINLKDKKLPEGITPAIVKKAFPDLIAPVK